MGNSMPYIRGVDGKVHDYADYEDDVKYNLKEEMRKKDKAKSNLKCDSCNYRLSFMEKDVCMGLCPKCGRDSLIEC